MNKVINFSDYQELKKMGIPFSVFRSIKKLQKHFNKPLIVNSNFRCRKKKGV